MVRVTINIPDKAWAFLRKIEYDDFDEMLKHVIGADLEFWQNDANPSMLAECHEALRLIGQEDRIVRVDEVKPVTLKKLSLFTCRTMTRPNGSKIHLEKGKEASKYE